MVEIFRTITKVAEFKATVLISGESGVGQGARGAGAPRAFVRTNGRLRRRQLRRHPREPARERAVRPQEGGLHRRHQRPARALRGGERRHAASSTRSASCRSSLQVKLLRVLQEDDDPPRRRHEGHQGRRAHRRRDAPGSRRRGQGRALPRGPLLPHQRARRRHPPAARAPRGHHPARRPLRRAQQRPPGHAASAASPPRRAKLLMEYGWPGNIRELENTIERAMVLAEGDMLEIGDLPERIREALDPVQMQLASGELSIKKTSCAIEEILIRRASRRPRATARARPRSWRSATEPCSTRSRTTRSPTCRARPASQRLRARPVKRPKRLRSR